MVCQGDFCGIYRKAYKENNQIIRGENIMKKVIIEMENGDVMKGELYPETAPITVANFEKLVNEGFYENGGAVRRIPVAIGGFSYIPPIPSEIDVIEGILNILHSEMDSIDIAIELALFCMKTQAFIDGNKRASISLPITL